MNARNHMGFDLGKLETLHRRRRGNSSSTLRIHSPPQYASTSLSRLPCTDPAWLPQSLLPLAHSHPEPSTLLEFLPSRMFSPLS